MSVTAVIDQPPPSPPPSLSGENQYGLHHIVQHNAAMQQQQQQYPLDDGYIHSGQATTYGSPASGHLSIDQYGRETYQNNFQDNVNVGLGIQYTKDWYGSPSHYQNLPPGYTSAFPGQTKQYLSQRGSAQSPPTPTASDLSSGERRTARNSRAIAPNGSSRQSRNNARKSSRALVTPKAKRSGKQSKSDKPKVPKINAPLSELTKAYNNIPIRNMEEWVNRPTETRRQEVEKRNGYVTRPMNSFMLYRSAYAERTKMWCLQNNHQIVSSVSGESWPMEPPEVREQYNEYARIERDNHQKAHPGYKFSPSKAQGPGRKRKGNSDVSEDDEPSDLDDPDFDWRPSSGRRTKAKSSKRQGREAGYPVNSAPGNDMIFNRSSYQATNPGKPLPSAMAEQDLFGEYYQTTIHPSFNDPNVEDVRIRRTEFPSMHSGGDSRLLGLPGAHHYELLDNRSFEGNPTLLDEPQVDPTLLAYNSGFGGQSNGVFTEQQFRNYNDDVLYGTNSRALGQHPGDGYHQGHEPWQFGDAALMDGANEFDRWMAENNNR